MATRKEIEETLAVTMAQGGTQLIINTPDLARLLRNAPEDNETIAALENELVAYSERIDALENELTELRGSIPVGVEASEAEHTQVNGLNDRIDHLGRALAECEENCRGHIFRVEKRDKTIADYDAQVPGYLQSIKDQGKLIGEQVAKIAELERAK